MNSLAVPGLLLSDHRVEVPLDHADPDGATISVYAREVRAAERAGDELPWLLFLQGGPGSKAPRPTERGGWLGEAVKSYRVLLLDQRGTGRSTPVTERTPDRFADARALADHLARFRADSIVADAEVLRRHLAGERPWTTLGQSYGGFCTFTYLSWAPEGLERCLVTGGIPGITATAEDVYRRTWPRVLDKNAEHFHRFPADQDVLNRVRDTVVARPVRLPGGDRLTVARLQALGIVLGMSYGSAQLHYLLEEAFDGDALAPAFLAEVEQRTGHVGKPLYAVLQEACYCSGTSSRWAAQRVREAEFPAASPDATDLLFTGEMKEAWVFDDEARLAPFADAMELLHAKEDWPALYDPARLASNEVPVAAAVYHDDLYVDAELSLATARSTPQVRVWVTNEYAHDGVRADARVFTRLRDLASGWI